jgi:hydrogenase expression/formation protein HypD
VSTIIGSRPYEFISHDYGVPCVIAGFEPLDILQSILMMVQQIESGSSQVEIEYRRIVRPEGNTAALKILDEVFEVCPVPWRGLGVIPQSGLSIKKKYGQFDARSVFHISVESKGEPAGCLCGAILRGVNIPPDCAFFGKACTPESPIGPCMVSSEGTCAAYYKYSGAI